MRFLRGKWLAAMAAASVLVMGQSAFAAIHWDNAAPGDTFWETDTNWLGDVEPTAVDIAAFGDIAGLTPDVIGGPNLATTGTVLGVSLKALSTPGGAGWTLIGAGELTIDADGIVSTGGSGTTNTVSIADIVLADDQTWSSNGDVAHSLIVNSDVDLDGNDLSVDGIGIIALNGVISGAGDVIKNGGGTTTINGTNTFTGSPTLNAGTLVLGNDAALGDAANVFEINGGNLLASGSRMIAQDMLWNGSFTFGNGGAFDFTGDTDLTDTLTVTLENTDGLTITGDIDTEGHTLTFTSTTSSTVVIDGAISDTGGLVLAGNAEAILNGTNTYTGSTTLVGSSDLLISATGSITSNVAMTENADLTIDAGGVVTGDVTSSGTSSSDIVVNGTITGNVSLSGSAELYGTGTIGGDLDASDNSLVGPGNSIGTLEVIGNAVFNAGSTLEAEIDVDAGTNDLLDVTGTATLEEDSVIEVVQLDTDFVTTGDSFTVITADGGVTDNGVILSGLFNDNNADPENLFVSFEVDEDFDNGDTDFTVVAVRDTYASAASTSNRAAVAGAIDADAVGGVTTGSDEHSRTVLLDYAGSFSSFNAILDQISPEAYGAVAESAAKNSQFINQSLANQLHQRRSSAASVATIEVNQDVRLVSASNDPALLAYASSATSGANYEGLNVFAQPFGRFGERDSDTDRVGYDFDTYGILVGVDTSVADGILVGIFFAYNHTDIDFTTIGGGADVDTIRGGAYVNGKWDKVVASAAVSFGYHWNDLNKTILGVTSSTDSDAWDVSVYAELGYEIELSGPETVVTPLIAIDYSHYDAGGFTETGSSVTNLNISGNEVDTLRMWLGARFAHHTIVQETKVVIDAYAGWVHNFLDENEIQASFANAGGSSFTVKSGVGNDDGASFGVGVTVVPNDDMSLFLRYDGEMGSDIEIHTISAGLVVGF